MLAVRVLECQVELVVLLQRPGTPVPRDTERFRRAAAVRHVDRYVLRELRRVGRATAVPVALGDEPRHLSALVRRVIPSSGRRRRRRLRLRAAADIFPEIRVRPRQVAVHAVRGGPVERARVRQRARSAVRSSGVRQDPYLSNHENAIIA